MRDRIVPVTLSQLPTSLLTQAAREEIGKELRGRGDNNVIADLLAAALHPSDDIYWVSLEAYRRVFGERQAA